MNTKTVKQVVNNPTTTQGTLKGTVWTTKLANKIESGELTIQDSNEVLDVVYHGKKYSIGVNTFVAKAFYEAAKDDSYIQPLEYMEAGFISPQQRDIAELIKQAGGNISTTKKELSAQEYKLNCISLNLPTIDPELIEELDNRVLAVKPDTTKKDLMEIINTYHSLFIKEEQRETYLVKLEKEEKEKTKFVEVAKLGIIDITSADGNHKGYIAPKASPEETKKFVDGLPDTLADHGFTFTGKDYDLDKMMLVISFKDKE